MSRTVLITPSWQINVWNGIARLSESIAESLSILGREVIVLTPTIPNGGARARWDDGIQVLEIPNNPPGSWKDNIAQVVRGLREVSEVIIIDSLTWQSVKQFLVGKIPTIGIVIFGLCAQGEKLPSPRTKELIEEEKAFIREVDICLVNNEILRERLKTKLNRDIGKLEMVVSQVPETTAMLRTEVTKRNGSVVVVGKVAPELGVEKIIRVMPSLPWLTLAVVGMPRSGIELNRTMVLVSRMGLENRVTFTGWKKTKEVLQMVREAEFVVAPSQVEYFGYSVMDAMLMETAVIASTANVHLEIVHDSESGMLFQNLDELTYALTTMHECKELRQLMIETAGNISEERGVGVMVDNLSSLIQIPKGG